MPSKTTIEFKAFLFLIAISSISACGEKNSRELEKATTAYQSHDTKTALDILSPLAKEGEAEAQFLLGKIHYEKAASLVTDSRGVYQASNKPIIKQEYLEAHSWFLKAAEQEHAEAEASLGEMYNTGKGVEKNDEEAIRWIKKSAENGSSRGQSYLGTVYLRGKLLPRDYDLAMHWYKKSAAQEYPDAEYSLALMYERGQGVQSDHKEASTWMAKAASHGHAEAKSLLGWR